MTFLKVEIIGICLRVFFLNEWESILKFYLNLKKKSSLTSICYLYIFVHIIEKKMSVAINKMLDYKERTKRNWVKRTIKLFLSTTDYKLCFHLTFRARVKSDVKILDATSSNPDWIVESKINMKNTAATFTARRKENVSRLPNA